MGLRQHAQTLFPQYSALDRLQRLVMTPEGIAAPEPVPVHLLCNIQAVHPIFGRSAKSGRSVEQQTTVGVWKCLVWFGPAALAVDC